MAVSQKFDISATPAFKNFQAYVDQRLAEDPESSGAEQPEFEEGVLEHLHEIGREVLQRDITRHDVDVAGVIVGEKQHRRKDRVPKNYETTLGTVRVKRTVYVERGGHGGPSVVPLEHRLGMVDGTWTLKAAEFGCRYMEGNTSVKSAELLGLHKGMAPSPSHLDRLAKAVGATWEDNREKFQEELRHHDELPPREDVSAVMSSVDGVMVPMKDAPRGKGSNAPKGHREASCGVICLLNSDGERLKTIKIGRMPEAKKVTLTEQMSNEMSWLKAQYPGVIWHAISDGARTNWSIFSDMALKVGVQLDRTLDFWHAMEHLAVAFALVWGKDSPRAKEEHDRWKKLLLTNCHGPGKLLRRLEELAEQVRGKKRRAEFDRELRYFKTNKEAGRMRWATLRKHNLPIGSGVEEAACKTLVTQRMKCSGMSWLQDGGQAILTLRSLQQSGQMDAAWLVLGAALRVDVRTDPDPKRKRPEIRKAA